MDELFLYRLFSNILVQSTVIEGRFVVAEGYGNDLNANNNDDIIKNALGQLTTVKKYPCGVLMPPVEVVADRGKGWSRFQLEMYFLTTTYTGSNGIKGVAGAIQPGGTNTSEHPIMWDWKDMRECGGNFRTALNAVIKLRRLHGQVREVQDAADVYRRVSMMNNDRLSGVVLSFQMDLFGPCNVADYPAGALESIVIPEAIIHPLHKH